MSWSRFRLNSFPSSVQTEKKYEKKTKTDAFTSHRVMSGTTTEAEAGSYFDSSDRMLSFHWTTFPRRLWAKLRAGFSRPWTQQLTCCSPSSLLFVARSETVINFDKTRFVRKAAGARWGHLRWGHFQPNTFKTRADLKMCEFMIESIK